MTVRECYALIGDYGEVVQRLMKDELIIRFARKFINDPSYASLCRAYEEQDFTEVFHCAHTLKGVCKNLGFTGLGNISSQITEICRDEKPHDIAALMQQLKEEYHKVTEAINSID